MEMQIWPKGCSLPAPPLDNNFSSIFRNVRCLFLESPGMYQK